MNGPTPEIVQSAFAFLNVRDPLVAWLVYRGEIVSAAEAHDHALSFWTARYLSQIGSDAERARRWVTEVALEQVRAESYPDAVSRLTGFYAFPDSETALRAGRAWDASFSDELRAEIGIRAGARVSQYDSQWITHEFDSSSRDWMSRYLAGEPYHDSPVWELLVDGRAYVFGTELREAAYEVVKVTWPRSLALLELARLGVELNSDLGLTVVVIGNVSGRLRAHFALNFIDAQNRQFLERLGAFEGPRNDAVLAPGSELVLPDLTARGFDL